MSQLLFFRLAWWNKNKQIAKDAGQTTRAFKTNENDAPAEPPASHIWLYRIPCRLVRDTCSTPWSEHVYSYLEYLNLTSIPIERYNDE